MTACVVAACAVESRRAGCRRFRSPVVVEHGPLPDVDLEVARTWKVTGSFPSGDTHGSSEESLRGPDWVMFRVHQQPGVLLMGLEPWLSGLVWRRLPEPGESRVFCTGDRGFDRLNRAVGLTRVRTYSVPENSVLKNMFTITFDPEMDPAEAASKYESLEGVVYAEPNGYFLMERRRSAPKAPAGLRLPPEEERRFPERALARK